MYGLAITCVNCGLCVQYFTGSNGCFLERRNVAATWSWLMVLLFIPILGFLLYVMLGQNLSRRKLYKWNNRMLERVQPSCRAAAAADGRRTFPYIDPMVSRVSLFDLFECRDE